jgi:hypothetical protein
LHYAVKFDEKNKIWHRNLTTVNFLLEKKAVKDFWNRLGRCPKDIVKRNPDSIIKLLLQNATNTTLVTVRTKCRVIHFVDCTRIGH